MNNPQDYFNTQTEDINNALSDNILNDVLEQISPQQIGQIAGIHEEIRSQDANGNITLTSRDYGPVSAMMKLDDELTLEKQRIESEKQQMMIQQQYEFNLRMNQMQNQFQLQQQMFGMMGYIQELQTKMIGLTSMVEKQQLLLDNPQPRFNDSKLLENKTVFKPDEKDVVDVEYKIIETDASIKNDAEISVKNYAKRVTNDDFFEIVDDDLME